MYIRSDVLKMTEGLGSIHRFLDWMEADLNASLQRKEGRGNEKADKRKKNERKVQYLFALPHVSLLVWMLDFHDKSQLLKRLGQINIRDTLIFKRLKNQLFAFRNFLEFRLKKNSIEEYRCRLKLLM